MLKLCRFGIAIGFCVLSNLAILNVRAFDTPQHHELTENVLLSIRVTIAGQQRAFSDIAREQIRLGNGSVDWGLSQAWFFSARHFTDEDFVKSSQRLIDLKTEILRLVRLNDAVYKPRDGYNARLLLGAALHAVQDFYSHSNWVERGGAGPISVFGTGLLEKPSLTLHACPSDPNVLGPDNGGGLTSGYFVGVQSSWPLVGCGKWWLPEGKCFHGNYTDVCRGINKDKPGYGRPGFNDHQSAMSVAELATRAYIDLITNELAGEDVALRRLLGIGKSAVFVVDTTGGMGEELPRVKALAAAVVQRMQSRPADEPTEWVLVPFNDPVFDFYRANFPREDDPPYITTNPSEFLTLMNALVSWGGGDCREPSQAALRTAVNAAVPGSEVFLLHRLEPKGSGFGKRDYPGSKGEKNLDHLRHHEYL